jgi:hypothetical protein
MKNSFMVVAETVGEGFEGRIGQLQKLDKNKETPSLEL